MLFTDFEKRPVVLSFDQRRGTTDGGAVQAANWRYGLIEAMAGCLRDRRQAGKVEHSFVELLGKRIHGLACGYPDANDEARLEGDPIHKMLVGRDLASQPTLSRFENAAGPQALYRMGMELVRSVIEHHGKRLGGHVDATRTLVETRSNGRCFGAPHGAALTYVLPLPRRLPASGQGNRGHGRISETTA